VTWWGEWATGMCRQVQGSARTACPALQSPLSMLTESQVNSLSRTSLLPNSRSIPRCLINFTFRKVTVVCLSEENPGIESESA
jgi:hypothetical protein